jgi:tetratricopeptide (TPR) repeat protein
LRIVGSLSEYWYKEGRVVEGQFWAERVLEEAGEDWISLYGRTLNAAGLFTFVIGDHDTAIKHYRDALKILEQLDDRVNFAWSLVSLGYVLTAFPEKIQEGIRLAEHGLEQFRELGDKQMISRALNNLGEIYRTANDYESAGKVYEECILISEEIGDRHRYGINLANLAYVALNQGDYDKADALMKASFKVRQELGLQFRIAEGFAGMALPVAWMRNPLRAARLLGASEALFEALGITLQPPNQMEIDKGISAVRQQLDEVTFDRAWQEGRDMSLDEAIAYALGE